MPILQASITQNFLYHYAMAMQFLGLNKHLIGIMMQVTECKYSSPVLRYDLVYDRI